MLHLGTSHNKVHRLSLRVHEMQNSESGVHGTVRAFTASEIRFR